jgi:hypothetical protein
MRAHAKALQADKYRMGVFSFVGLTNALTIGLSPELPFSVGRPILAAVKPAEKPAAD